MKYSFYLLSLGWLLLSHDLTAQEERYGYFCGENPFRTEIVRVVASDDDCTSYELNVTYTQGCKHALSHYTVAMSCGKITEAGNSENWKQEFGYDRTTGLYGVKIDNIPNFGETSLKSFSVYFTVCDDDRDHTCKRTDSTSCCYPIVAYKAGTCVYYDKLKGSCPAPTPQLNATLWKQDVTCFGLNNGSLSVSADGGEEPYSYQWSTGDTTSFISDLAPGLYDVTVTDANGSQVTLDQTITGPEKINVEGVVSSAGCNGQQDGTIDITITGGAGGYTFAWSNGAGTEDISSLAPGSYNVTVQDSVGCSAEASFVIENGSSLSITATPALPACGQTNGSIDIAVTGGTLPYTYKWSNGSMEEDLENVGPGNYKVTVTDTEGCTVEAIYNLKENNTLKLSAVVKQTSCLEDGSGAIDLLVQGGTEPYTYTWSNGASTEDISDLTAGIYSVTVTDANGCSATMQVSVTRKTFQVSSQVTQPSCQAGSGGSVVLTPFGGIEPYTYQWSTGAATNSVEGLSPGIYTVTITDASGCSRDLVYVISDPVPITATAIVSNNQCNAEGAFNIDLTVTGGQGPYTYEWSNGSSDEDPDSLATGIYTVTITDVNGCSAVNEVEVSGSTQGWTCLIDQPDTIPLCGSIDNMLATSIVGAESYSWSVQSSDGQWQITSESTENEITYTAGGVNSSATFTLTIQKDGCSQTCTYEVTTCNDENTTPGDGGNDQGDDTCNDCFDSKIVKVFADGSCYTYEVTVSTTGECDHELSHWDIAIPCGYVKNYSNSDGWQMEKGEDPTTGLYGLKVDNVQHFGNTADHFTVRFTLCFDDGTCEQELQDWKPVIAYKAGQCITYDTLELESDIPEDDSHTCKVYPNPFKDRFTFEWTADKDENVSLDLYDLQGRHVRKLYSGKTYKGTHYRVDCADLPGSTYIYHFNTSRGTTHGKLCRSE